MAGSQATTEADKYAAAAVAIWDDICNALSPIIGLGGVAALYKRALSQRLADYPWLSNVSEQPLQPGDFATLRAQLSIQKQSDAVAANDALLRSLVQLLNHLIGVALTARLLQSVWEKHGYTAQDDPP